jgi:hypothetical protein
MIFPTTSLPISCGHFNGRFDRSRSPAGSRLGNGGASMEGRTVDPVVPPGQRSVLVTCLAWRMIAGAGQHPVQVPYIHMGFQSDQRPQMSDDVRQLWNGLRIKKVPRKPVPTPVPTEFPDGMLA